MEIRKPVVADAAVILENRLVFIEEVTHAVLPANFKEETYAIFRRISPMGGWFVISLLSRTESSP